MALYGFIWQYYPENLWLNQQNDPNCMALYGFFGFFWYVQQLAIGISQQRHVVSKENWVGLSLGSLVCSEMSCLTHQNDLVGY
jgi:hypothetical protein